MSAGIATQFCRIFPKLTKICQTRQNFTPGSLIACFQKKSIIWIYNLVAKRRCNDEPMYSDLIKSLCRMKSDMLQHHITGIRLPQLGCGLDKLDQKHVLLNIFNVFGDTEITVDIFLLEVPNPLGQKVFS